MPYKKAFSLFLAALLVPLLALAQSVELNPDHPTRYVVKKGDTLWDISEHFLVEPWRWPEIWQLNPQVRNPHLIYPGDELALFYRDGKPVVQLTRRGEGAPGEQVPGEQVPGEQVTRQQVGPRTVKLTPQAYVTERDDAIPAIPMDTIRPFLARP
ncbi:MAG: LysM peptidoglycan-binding domain-containing protein, partial [Gammaproteobacteria bacterium]|nr:LysM peptidoglycan-binding domain-containing protein [Gammaproteobacteria bacterium]NIP89922.1 LysM peptidoglycan-binding domain-containing protein [Gammaproteobacteria bacterium]NIR24781.1 LysM peptidoglycan-binding domain-containing protein [Gammaproteobacteria bacterium]NIS06444.1 LysM peptidoglycan-binding domain-containing protein [Gammaproteobacteria bacterium]NIU42575.1 LysM peptidoglycan-binding domain-containing protein [Gammaproteobacteria bacterium]